MEIKELEQKENETLLNFIERVRNMHQELFPDVTIMSQIAKFDEEYDEMIEATKHIAEESDKFLEELVDMFIVACGILRFNESIGYCLCKSIADDFIYKKDDAGNNCLSELTTKVIEKMNKNIKRVWSKTADGNYKHVSYLN